MIPGAPLSDVLARSWSLSLSDVGINSWICITTIPQSVNVVVHLPTEQLYLVRPLAATVLLHTVLKRNSGSCQTGVPYSSYMTLPIRHTTAVSISTWAHFSTLWNLQVMRHDCMVFPVFIQFDLPPLQRGAILGEKISGGVGNASYGAGIPIHVITLHLPTMCQLPLCSLLLVNSVLI